MKLETITVTPEIYVEIHMDESESGDPRQADNLTVIVADHRRYSIGDREPNSGERTAFAHGGWQGLYDYLKKEEGMIAFRKIGMYDHSGITIYPVDFDDDDGEHAFDSGGWDSGIVGFVYITAQRFTELCGDNDPFQMVDEKSSLMGGEISTQRIRVEKHLDDELREYDSYLRGEVYGFVIKRKHDVQCRIADCPHDEQITSSWGYVGDVSDVRKEALLAADVV